MPSDLRIPTAVSLGKHAVLPLCPDLFRFGPPVYLIFDTPVAGLLLSSAKFVSRIFNGGLSEIRGPGGLDF